ncbi:MAG: hypothetical protein GQ574_14380 [Crocinitomix sp.]|nr:hypothetical protein [Crocinitomix sp.]
MCSLYGNCFTRLGLIDQNTVVFYQNVNRKVFDQIDEKRAKSEVALVHPRSGKTVYGLDAFLKILSNERSVLKRLFQVKWLYFLLEKLYRLISFNRKVIAGSTDSSDGRVCTPPIHIPYRIIYLILVALFTGLMVNGFTTLLDAELGVAHVGWREYAVCFGQIAWQFAALSLIDPAKRLDYLGNMSTVSIIGALLLIPLFIADYFLDFCWMQLMIGFALVVGTMFYLHVKRCKRLGLPFIVSASWVMFRTIVLIIVLTLIYLN